MVYGSLGRFRKRARSHQKAQCASLWYLAREWKKGALQAAVSVWRAHLRMTKAIFALGCYATSAQPNYFATT